MDLRLTDNKTKKIIYNKNSNLINFDNLLYNMRIFMIYNRR